jgi:hypothetical protein
MLHFWYKLVLLFTVPVLGISTLNAAPDSTKLPPLKTNYLLRAHTVSLAIDSNYVFTLIVPLAFTVNLLLTRCGWLALT